MLNSGQLRYLSTNSAQTSFTLAAGRVAGSSLTAAQKILYFGNASGVDISFIGTGADDSTADYKIWLVMAPASEQPKDTPSEVELVLFSSGTKTLSTAVGATGGALVASTERIADTITHTMAAAGTALLTNYGLSAPTVFSPGSNTPGRLTIPLLSRICNGIIVEFDLTGATGANACYSLTG